LAAACTVARDVVVDFENVASGKIADASGQPCAWLRGGARICADAHAGAGALDVGGAGRQGVVAFGEAFAAGKQGTIELWCKPRVPGGIIVGKYGAINLEFVRGRGQVRFGLKLKEAGWINCTSPARSVQAHKWLHIRASWGAAGMLLFLDGRAVAQAPLPETYEWFTGDRPLLLGSYAWPGGYASWFLDGVIDDFTYQPVQAPFEGELPQAARAAEVLDIRLPKTPKPDYGMPAPDSVRGRVALDLNGNGVAELAEDGVPGVSVSDGYSVVSTDAQGQYCLRPSAHAVFVFITRPSGRDVVGHWYKPVSQTVDFALRRSALPEDEYTFVQVTDTHVSGDRRSLAGLSRFVREVNALDPPPRFVFNSGDLVNLDKQLKAPDATGHRFFRSYTGIMNHLRAPCYNVAGDHTDSGYRLDRFPLGDHRAGKALYWEYLGPNLFSFEYGRLHFVSVDVVYHLAKTSHTMIPLHRAWFEQDLSNRTPGTVVLTASENPLEGSVAGFTELARQNDIRLQLVGDTHVVSTKRQPVPSRSHGALSGTWWDGPCADLHPQGYMIYQARGTELDCFYKGLGQRVSIVSPAYGERVEGAVTVSAHLVQPRPGERLQCSLNGGEWQDMKVVGRPFHRLLCETNWDSTAAADGLAEIKVRSVPEGETRESVAVIDNGTPFPPCEQAATLTFTVGRVITAPHSPRRPVSVLLNSQAVGSLAPGGKGERSFAIPPELVRKVNVLTFGLGEPQDLFSISAPTLVLGDAALQDPRAAAIRNVRANHWPQGTVARAGFVVGHDARETSFALRQQTFCFVLP